MDRARERSFVWALADSAAQSMRPDTHAWLCAKIGAGEQESAIADLLVFFANTGGELPYELAGPLRVWIRGYAGTEREAVLLRLYDRIRVSVMTHATAREPAVKARRRPATDPRPTGRHRERR